MKIKSSKSKGLERLHSLVDELSDRDDQLKRDMRLFEEFFETFPIPVTMWSVSLEKTLLSNRYRKKKKEKANKHYDVNIRQQKRKIGDLAIKSSTTQTRKQKQEKNLFLSRI